MPSRTALPRQLQGRPFTLAEADQLGVAHHLLRPPRFLTPHRGVKVPGDLPAGLLVDVVAASLALPPGSLISGWTALRLLDLPTPRGRPEPVGRVVQARVPLPVSRLPTPGLVRTTRRAEDEEHLLVTPEVLELLAPGSRFLRLQHPLSAWCDLAPSLPFTDAVALGDGVRCRFASQQRMERAVEARRGRRGAVVLRTVLAAVRFRVDSPMESGTRLLLVDAGLPEPECGVVLLEGTPGRCRVDLCWRAWRVVVEYDGDVHRTERGQWRRDEAKRAALREAGWTVVVLNGDDLSPARAGAREATAQRVRLALRRAGAPV